MPAQIDPTFDGSLRCTARHISTTKILITDAAKALGSLGKSFSPADLVRVGAASK